MIDNKQSPPAPPETPQTRPPQQKGEKGERGKGKMRNMPLFIIIAIAVLTPLASTIMFYAWKPEAATHKGEVITAQESPAIFPPPSWQKANDEVEDWREDWRGKWTLLQTTPSAQCDEECRRRLCRMRQLRLMLPGHYLRLNRAWLINTPAAANDGTTKTGGESIAKTGGDNTAKPASGKSAGITSITASNDCGEIQNQTAAAKRAAKVDILQGVIILRGDNAKLPKASANWQRKDYIYLIDPAGRLAMRFSPTINIYNIRSDLSRLLKLSRGWRQTK